MWNWTDPANPRRSSYFLNAWMAGTQDYGRLAAINRPADVIYLSESAENRTGDHYHPFYWGSPPEQVNGFMNGFTWNAALNETREIALRRHQGGFNVGFADGHSKWVQWSRTWRVPATALQGAFDPRQ